MAFILNGKFYNLTTNGVKELLKNVEPRGRSKYFIETDNKKYPIKQVVAVATGLPLIMFTSADACRILTRLGFKIDSEESNMLYHEALASSY